MSHFYCLLDDYNYYLENVITGEARIWLSQGRCLKATLSASSIIFVIGFFCWASRCRTEIMLHKNVLRFEIICQPGLPVSHAVYKSSSCQQCTAPLDLITDHAASNHSKCIRSSVYVTEDTSQQPFTAHRYNRRYTNLLVEYAS